MQDVKPTKSRGRNQLRPDMIRRVEGEPKLVDPSGWISEGAPEEQKGSDGSSPTARAESSSGDSSSMVHTGSGEGGDKQGRLQTPVEDMYVLYIVYFADINLRNLHSGRIQTTRLLKRCNPLQGLLRQQVRNHR